MNDNSLMRFGKYKGEKLANVPAEYLMWLYNGNISRGELRDYIRANQHVLEHEIKQGNTAKK